MLQNTSVNSVIPPPTATLDNEGGRPGQHSVSTPLAPGRGEKTQTLIPTSLSTATTSQLHAKRHRIPSLSYSSEESSDGEGEWGDTRSKQMHKKYQQGQQGQGQEVLQDTLVEVKQMLNLLCDKVEKNERCLKELQNLQNSRFSEMHVNICSHICTCTCICICNN